LIEFIIFLQIERLRAIISDPKNGYLQFSPLPLPLDARIQVTGIIPGKMKPINFILQFQLKHEKIN